MHSELILYTTFIGGIGGLLLILANRASKWSSKLMMLGMAGGIFAAFSQGQIQIGFIIGFAIPLTLVGLVLGFLIDVIFRPKNKEKINISNPPKTNPTLIQRPEIPKAKQENLNANPANKTALKPRTSSPRSTQAPQPIRIVTFMERLELERKEAVFKERLYKFLVVVMLLIPVGTVLYALFA
jgi:glycopeptide antibiotics resistance protein